jgi:hypothetical protein
MDEVISSTVPKQKTMEEEFLQYKDQIATLFI